MWLLGVSLFLAALVAVLVGLRIWFNRMQDVRKPLVGCVKDLGQFLGLLITQRLLRFGGR